MSMCNINVAQNVTLSCGRPARTPCGLARHPLRLPLPSNALRQENLHQRLIRHTALVGQHLELRQEHSRKPQRNRRKSPECRRNVDNRLPNTRENLVKRSPTERHRKVVGKSRKRCQKVDGASSASRLNIESRLKVGRKLRNVARENRWKVAG